MAAAARRTGDDADPAERARDIALRVLTGAPRSAAQLREALVTRDVPEPIADEVIERYREVGLLDDAALAATVARTRHGERGQSRRAIAQELRRKGFEDRHIEEALTQISDEDERDSAAELAQRRWDALSSVPRDARMRRVAAFLGRKGYPAGQAYGLVRALERADIVEDREVHPAEEEPT